MLQSKSLLLLTALAFVCTAATAGTSGAAPRHEPIATRAVVSVAPVLLGASVMMMASDKVQSFSTELSGITRWTVDAMRDGGHGATEIDLLREDEVVRQTIRLGKDVIRQHRIRPAERLVIEQSGKRSFVLKRGKVILTPLAYPQRGTASSSARP